MFKVLIVEDDTEKLRNITSTLESVEINLESIDHVVDSMSAKKMIKEKLYDLLILDIAIPLRKSERVDLEGGIKLLKEILHRENYKVPVHIIGLTAREEIFNQAASEFNSQILSVIRYSDSDIEWQKQLSKGVEHRMLSKMSSLSEEIPYHYDIAIINAVEVEFQAIKALSKTWERVILSQDSSPYYKTIFERDGKSFNVIAACASQMGMNASSVLTMKLIYNFRPRYLFMTGIAASIKNTSSHGFGDILVIDESWDGGAGKLTQNDNGETVFLPTAQHIRLDFDVSEKIRVLKSHTDLLRKIKDGWNGEVPNTELNIHIGSVASVAGVTENKAVIDELRIKDRKLLGLEMEAYGMYFSAKNCSNPRPIAVALKSVSDFANTSKNDIFQKYASYTSAQVMYEYIMREL